MKHERTKAWLHLEETHLTYKSVQLPSEPPLVDAAIQLEELRDGPHREDALKNALESKHNAKHRNYIKQVAF